MIPSPELQAKIAIWRAKAVDNTLTPEDMAEYIKSLRGERMSAAATTDKARRAKATKIIPTAEDLLGELGMD